MMIAKEELETQYMIPDAFNVQYPNTAFNCSFSWENSLSVDPGYGPFNFSANASWLQNGGFSLVGGRIL